MTARSKNRNESKTNDNALLSTSVSSVPSWMSEQEDLGAGDLARYVVPQRIKIVQRQAREELLDHYNPGDLILSPMMSPLVTRKSKGDAPASFTFTPVLFFPEWCTWTPIASRGDGAPPVIYRTVDPRDPVATKSKNPSLRKEMIDGVECRHIEHLNFMVVIREPRQLGDPVILSFASGSHMCGSNFAALWRMRSAPLYGCVFQAVVSIRKNQYGDWYVINVSNPDSCSPWVSKEEFPELKKLHENLQSLLDQSRIRIDYDEEPSTDPGEVSEAKSKF